MGADDRTESREELLRLWQEHAERLLRMLESLGERLPLREAGFVREYVTHNEFGVAFHHLAYSIEEHDVRLDQQQIELMDELGAVLDEEDLWTRVRASLDA